jgi:hypothetical protein
LKGGRAKLLFSSNNDALKQKMKKWRELLVASLNKLLRPIKKQDMTIKQEGQKTILTNTELRSCRQ